MLNRKAARRYARALFQWAADNNQVDTTQGELERVLPQIRAVPDFEKVLVHPLIPHAQKGELLRRAFEGRIADPLLGFLVLLEERHRMDVLPAVCEDFTQQAMSYRGEVEGEVRSAVPVTAAERERLQRVLDRRLGKRARLSFQTDPELIGGLVVRVGDMVIDGSVKTSLGALREQLKRASFRAA